jgi:phosphocarrier protein
MSVMTLITCNLKIVNRRGLHARASAKFSKLAGQYKCDIHVTCADVTAPGRSILDLLMLAASQGKEIAITCNGEDAEQAIDALSSLVERGFDENDDDGAG